MAISDFSKIYREGAIRVMESSHARHYNWVINWNYINSYAVFIYTRNFILELEIWLAKITPITLNNRWPKNATYDPYAAV